MQTRRWSIIEAVSGTFIGLIYAFLLQWFLFWTYDVPVNHTTNALIVFWMTLASIVRSYYVRRFFNWLHYKLERTRLGAALEPKGPEYFIAQARKRIRKQLKELPHYVTVQTQSVAEQVQAYKNMKHKPVKRTPIGTGIK